MQYVFTPSSVQVMLYKCRARSEPSGTRWRTGGEVKGKQANGVRSQYNSTLPRNVVSPALLPLLLLMRTPRLPVVDWTDAPTDLNGLVRFGERRNLVSARVPSRSARAIPTLLVKWCDTYVPLLVKWCDTCVPLFKWCNTCLPPLLFKWCGTNVPTLLVKWCYTYVPLLVKWYDTCVPSFSGWVLLIGSIQFKSDAWRTIWQYVLFCNRGCAEEHYSGLRLPFMELYWQVTTEIRSGKPVLMPFCLLKISQGLTQDRTRATAMRDWQLWWLKFI